MYYYIFFANLFYEKICSIWCGIFTCTYIIEILVWLEILASFRYWVVVIFYSQMQELRTTFFWLLIASHLALFKRILQTTYMYYSSTYITSHCWLNSVFKIKLALFNFKILSKIKFSFVGPSLSFIPTKTPQSFTLTVVCHSNDDTKALKMADF